MSPELGQETTNKEVWMILRIMWEIDERTHYDEDIWMMMSVRENLALIEEVLMWWYSLKKEIEQ